MSGREPGGGRGTRRHVSPRPTMGNYSAAVAVPQWQIDLAMTDAINDALGEYLITEIGGAARRAGVAPEGCGAAR